MHEERDQKWFSMSPYLQAKAEIQKAGFLPVDKQTNNKCLCVHEASKPRVILMPLFFNQSSLVKVLGNLILLPFGSKES